MSEKIKSIITCDLDGKIETLSKGAVELFGYSEDEMVGKGRVSDFSDGEIVLGHVVNWLNESVEKGAWEGNTQRPAARSSVQSVSQSVSQSLPQS